ncbi:hypothetical protein K438DRAFT_1812418 [Mycena galopus ATCC 62051]|nr:hypothetical protein K438DRAFT_1812418 [Mycena galopus ATCC 62051]
MAEAQAASLPAASPSLKVSSHVVVKQQGVADISHVFAGVCFPPSYLVERGESLSTTVLAILTCLRSHLDHHPLATRIDPTILAILQGSHPLAANIEVATSRTLDFAEATFRSYENGFRELGGLADFSVLIPPPEFDYAVDVPSATGEGPGNNFFRTWSTMAVLPRTHFILIFMITPTTLLPSISLPPIELPSELLPLLSADSTGLETPVMSRSPSSLSLASGSPSRSSRPQSRSPSPYPTQRPTAPSKDDVILGICRSQIPEFEDIRLKARCLKGNRGTPLASLARCFLAMEHILLCLGLDPRTLESSRSFPLEDEKNINLNGEAIFDCFAWKARTFSSKRKLYKDAKSIALRTWKDDTSADIKLHTIYQGIQFLWADNGPLSSLDAPLPSPEAQGNEKSAADLRQAHLDSNWKSLYNKYTC